MMQKILNLLKRDGKKNIEALNCVEKLNNHGYVILKNVLTPEECQAINQDFHNFCCENPDQSNLFLMDSNNHSRLCNMHITSDAAKAAILKERVLGVLDEFFGEKACVATSLYFEQSSEQALHRDTPFFHTRPNNKFAGIWFALETVRKDSGPLVYYPGGHKIDIEIPVAENELDIDRAWRDYCRTIKQKVDDLGLIKEYGIIEQGDCLIWHPELPHGGSEIFEKGLTRKSMVFHCSPENSIMYGIGEFFGVKDYAAQKNHQVPISKSRKMIDQVRPFFANNN